MGFSQRLIVCGLVADLRRPAAPATRSGFVNALIASALICAGCTSAAEGQRLVKDISRLKRDQAQVRDKLTRQQRQIRRLKSALDSEQRTRGRHDADLGVQIERNRSEVAKTRGLAEENARGLIEYNTGATAQRNELGEKLARLEVVVEKQGQPKTPQDREELIAAGKARARSGEREEARRLLWAFVKKFKTDRRVPEVLVLIGNTYFRDRDYGKAIGAYRQLLETRKKSKYYPEALFQTGMSFVKLKFCTDARGFFQELLKRFKRHERRREARRQLSMISKNRRNRARCTS